MYCALRHIRFFCNFFFNFFYHFSVSILINIELIIKLIKTKLIFFSINLKYSQSNIAFLSSF